MPRVKRGVTKRRRHRRILNEAEGYFGTRSTLVKVARETVERAWRYAYRDRKQRKREFRSLWIARINAAARQHEISYSQLIHGLDKAGIEIDRKNLADLAVADPQAFGELATRAKTQLA
jgi:large subunit ribosomal protein L20